MIKKSRKQLHHVSMENINKIALSANDNKKMVAPDGVNSCPYGTGPGRVCKT